jgi:hypothetical protein
VLLPTGVAVSGIERRNRSILPFPPLGICDISIWVALLHASVIGVKALELSKSGVDRAIEGAVNSVLEGAKRITAKFEALKAFRHHYSAV